MAIARDIPNMAEFAKLVLGQPLQPWQQQMLDLIGGMDRGDIRKLVIPMPRGRSMSAFAYPPTTGERPGDMHPDPMSKWAQGKSGFIEPYRGYLAREP